MNREEILSKSREENKYEDECEQHFRIKGEALAKRIGLVLCLLLTIVEHLLTGTWFGSYATWTVYFAMQAADCLHAAVTVKKPLYWFIGIVAALATAGALAVFVLLCMDVSLFFR